MTQKRHLFEYVFTANYLNHIKLPGKRTAILLTVFRIGLKINQHPAKITKKISIDEIYSTGHKNGYQRSRLFENGSLHENLEKFGEEIW